MAPQDGMTTLRYLLSQQKPHIHCNLSAGRNPTGVTWPEVIVTIWNNFNLKNLNESYGHILDSPIPESWLAPLQPNQAFASFAINKAEDINHMLDWNDKMLQQTLQLAKTRLRLYPGIVLRYRCATTEKSFIPKLLNAGRKLAVDHVIALDDSTIQNLVVGLGRPSSKWSGRKLAQQIPDAKREISWPIRQLANICKIAQTRYGYIQTDEELVACCFSMNGEEWKAAIMPIPWTKYGNEVLTTDLAVWWLCMLAMSGSQHRAIVEENDMVDISDWDVVRLDGERGWVRRHRYSNFEEHANPPPPPTYQTPSPGNLATFGVAVGLHTDESFNLGVAHGDFSNSNNFIIPDATEFSNWGDLMDLDVEQDLYTASERGGE